MTETAAGITRPSFDDAYEDLTGLDDRAIAVHLGYDIEELYELLTDGALSNRQWLQLAEALEFVRLRRKPTPDNLAAQMILEMGRKELAGYLSAYLAESVPTGEQPDPESPEGKGSPLSDATASPKRKSTARSAPPTDAAE